MWEEVKNDSYVPGLLRKTGGVKMKEDLEQEKDAKKNHKVGGGKSRRAWGCES